MSSASQPQRREVLYAGRVQGVGFRYTTRSIASRFKVKGYVHNLPNGQVRVLAEGEGAELDRFLATIEVHLGHYIDRTDQTVLPAGGELSGFEIRL